MYDGIAVTMNCPFTNIKDSLLLLWGNTKEPGVTKIYVQHYIMWVFN